MSTAVTLGAFSPVARLTGTAESGRADFAGERICTAYLAPANLVATRLRRTLGVPASTSEGVCGGLNSRALQG
jgi:hypothetical protein